jgi:hypothetical protein
MKLFVNKYYPDFSAKVYTLLINTIMVFKMTTLKFGLGRRRLTTKSEKQLLTNIIIIGSSEEYATVLSIIKSTEIEAHIIGRVTPQY